MLGALSYLDSTYVHTTMIDAYNVHMSLLSQKTNIEPENTPLEKGKHLETTNSIKFLGSMLVLGLRW